MKHFCLIFALLTLLYAPGAYAKSKDFPHAEVKVSYSYAHKRLKTDAKAYDDEYVMLLLANSRYSKFFSPHTEYLDSLDSTPSGRALSDRLLHEGIKKYIETKDESAIPAKNGSMYVFKSLDDSTVTVYDQAGMSEFGYYTEPLAEMRWEIGDSIKNVLNYECVMAATDYHGRHWTVWFTTDIPLQDGPWKLCGLPGLILEASDSSGQHHFIATGIEACDNPIMPIYNPKKYDRMKRRDMLKIGRSYLTNGATMVNALISNTPGGERIEMKNNNDSSQADLHVDFLETDYHE
jgi:GLPGLI family protein